MVTPVNPFPVASKFIAAKDVEPQEDVLAQFILDERRLERRFRNSPRALRYLRQQAREAQVTLAKLLRKEYPQFFGTIPLDQVIDLLDGTLLRNIKRGIRNLRNAISSSGAPIEDLTDRITTLNGQKLTLETQKLGLEGDLSDANGEKATLQTELATLNTELAGLSPSTAGQVFLIATGALYNLGGEPFPPFLIPAIGFPGINETIAINAQMVLLQNAYAALEISVTSGNPEAVIASYNAFKTTFTTFKQMWTAFALLFNLGNATTLHTANAAADTALTTLTNAITAYQNKLNAIDDKEEEIVAKESEIDTIENNISIVADKISDQEDKIQAAEQELAQKFQVLAALRQQLRDLREIMRNIGELGEINGILFSFNVDLPPAPPTPEELIPLVEAQIATVENTIATLTAKIPNDQGYIDTDNIQIGVTGAQLVADLTLFYANSKAAFDVAIGTNAMEEDIGLFLLNPPVAINPITTPLAPLQAAWSSFKTKMDSLSWTKEDVLPIIPVLAEALQNMRDYIFDIPDLAPSANIGPILAEVDDLIQDFSGVLLDSVVYNVALASLAANQAMKVQDEADLAAAGASLLVLQGQLQDLQDSVGQTPPPVPIVFDGIDPDDLALIRGIRDIS